MKQVRIRYASLIHPILYHVSVKLAPLELKELEGISFCMMAAITLNFIVIMRMGRKTLNETTEQESGVSMPKS